MADYVITPNMNLIAPTPGVEPGPQYATDQNQSLTIIDGHNHSPGSGVPITPSGLDINTNLNFQNNSPYNVDSVIFSAPAANTGLTTLYTNTQTGGGIIDLFFNDGAGNVIALTKAGEVNATIASIPGESYSGGTFTWVQGAGSTTPANFDIGSVTIRPNTAGTTNGVVLGPPSAISSQYNVQLPIVPTVTSILQLDTSGNMLATLVPDNSTIVISSQTLQVPAGGITNTQIASQTILESNLALKPVSSATVVAGGVGISPSCGAFFTTSASFVPVTNLSITITTTGRPVYIALQPDGTQPPGNATGSSWDVGTGGSVASSPLCVFRDATLLSNVAIVPISATISGNYASPGFMYLDTPPAGTYTYTIQTYVYGGSSGMGLNYVVLVVYEI